MTSTSVTNGRPAITPDWQQRFAGSMHVCAGVPDEVPFQLDERTLRFGDSFTFLGRRKDLIELEILAALKEERSR